MLQEASLTKDEIASIRVQWPLLLEHKKAIRRSFYTNLFKQNKKVSGLFRESFLEIDALPDSWQFMYDNMDLVNDDPLKIKRLGLKHKTFGVKPNHYPFSKLALLETLEEFLGEKFTKETQIGWSKLFDSISTLMIKGSKRK